VAFPTALAPVGGQLSLQEHRSVQHVNFGIVHSMRQTLTAVTATRSEVRSFRFALLPLAIVVAIALCITVLPNNAWIYLTVWTLASFPLGILFGHCIRAER
jgi:hypothetical protein